MLPTRDERRERWNCNKVSSVPLTFYAQISTLSLRKNSSAHSTMHEFQVNPFHNGWIADLKAARRKARAAWNSLWCETTIPNRECVTASERCEIDSGEEFQHSHREFILAWRHRTYNASCNSELECRIWSTRLAQRVWCNRSIPRISIVLIILPVWFFSTNLE